MSEPSKFRGTQPSTGCPLCHSPPCSRDTMVPLMHVRLCQSLACSGDTMFPLVHVCLCHNPPCSRDMMFPLVHMRLCQSLACSGDTMFPHLHVCLYQSPVCSRETTLHWVFPLMSEPSKLWGHGPPLGVPCVRVQHAPVTWPSAGCSSRQSPASSRDSMFLHVRVYLSVPGMLRGHNSPLGFPPRVEARHAQWTQALHWVFPLVSEPGMLHGHGIPFHGCAGVRVRHAPGI